LKAEESSPPQVVRVEGRKGARVEEWEWRGRGGRWE